MWSEAKLMLTFCFVLGRKKTERPQALINGKKKSLKNFKITSQERHDAPVRAWTAVLWHKQEIRCRANCLISVQPSHVYAAFKGHISPWIGTQLQKYTITFTPTANLAHPIDLNACLWTVGGNPRKQGENVQTPHRRDPGHPAREWNPDPSSCEVT